jgi:hypothetical protein
MSPAWSRSDAALRFDVAPDDDRALFVSYLIASALAITWLTLVHVMPAAVLVIPAEPPIILVDPTPGWPAPPHSEARAVRPRDGLSPTTSRDPGAVRNAFKGNAGLVDAGNLLHRVDVTPSGGATQEATARKVGLETGVGSRTPGLTRNSGLPPGSGNVGTVRGNGVRRHAVTVAPPEVRAVLPGAAQVDASEVGQGARARVPQLERCYHQEGLTRNPSLAGLVRLGIDVEGGQVTSARIVDRTWAGAGVAETESCLVRAVRGWRLGGSTAHIVLPLSFTSSQTSPRASP